MTSELPLSSRKSHQVPAVASQKAKDCTFSRFLLGRGVGQLLFGFLLCSKQHGGTSDFVERGKEEVKHQLLWVKVSFPACRNRVCDITYL